MRCCKGSVETSFDLKVLKLRAVFRVEENDELPAFLGSTIRGVLGHAMRDSVCGATDALCHLCRFSDSCAYTVHFNSAGNIAESVNPFVLYVPIRNKIVWKRGDLLTFDITAFGKSAMASEFYIAGILRMADYGWGARRLKFSPVQIMNVLDKSLIWSDGQVWTHNFQPFFLQIEKRETESVLLRFNSPTRVVTKQKLQRKLAYDQIIQAILTRIRLIMHAYEGVVLEFDEEKLLEDAKHVQTVEEEWHFVDFLNVILKRTIGNSACLQSRASFGLKGISRRLRPSWRSEKWCKLEKIRPMGLGSTICIMCNISTGLS